MPEKKTIEKAKDALRKGKSPSTAAGEFIREEMESLQHGKRGVGSPKQAIAIGLAKARRAGVPLAPQGENAEQERSRRSMARAYEAGKKKKSLTPARKRTRAAAPQTLERKPKSVSKSARSRPAKAAATRRKRAATRSKS